MTNSTFEKFKPFNLLESEAAKYLRLSRLTVRNMRLAGEFVAGETFIKMGHRTVRYSERGLELWMQRRAGLV